MNKIIKPILYSVVGMPQSGSTLLLNLVRTIAEDYLGLNPKSYLYAKTNHCVKSQPYQMVGMINKEMLLQLMDQECQEPLAWYEEVIDITNYEQKTTILKEHHFQKEIADLSDIIFISKRSIDDCIKSRLRRGKALFSKGQHLSGNLWPDGDNERFKRYCKYLTDECYDEWLRSQPEKCHIFDYDKYCKDPHEEVKSIASKLGVEITEIECENIIKKSITYYDFNMHETCFTLTKITDKQKEIDFNKDHMDYICQNYSQFINTQKIENQYKPSFIRTKFTKFEWHNYTSASNASHIYLMNTLSKTAQGAPYIFYINTIFEKNSDKLKFGKVTLVIEHKLSYSDQITVADNLYMLENFINNSLDITRYIDKNGEKQLFEFFCVFTHLPINQETKGFYYQYDFKK